MAKRKKRLRQTIGINLRHYRAIKEMTQLELAENAGIDRSYVGHIELDNRLPTLSTLKKLGAALGIPWTVLVVD